MPQTTLNVTQLNAAAKQAHQKALEKLRLAEAALRLNGNKSFPYVLDENGKPHKASPKKRKQTKAGRVVVQGADLDGPTTRQAAIGRMNKRMTHRDIVMYILCSHGGRMSPEAMLQPFTDACATYGVEYSSDPINNITVAAADAIRWTMLETNNASAVKNRLYWMNEAQKADILVRWQNLRLFNCG